MARKITTDANKKPTTTATTADKPDLLVMAEAAKAASKAVKIVLDSKGKTFSRKAEGEELELVWKSLPMGDIPLVACESVIAMENALHKAAKAAYTIESRVDGFSVWNGNTRLWRVVGGRLKVTKAALAAVGATLGITGIEVSLANLVKFAKTKLTPVSK